MADQLRYFDITLTGVQPLLMHADDIDWADAMELWKNDADNKRLSKAGDDRSPAWRWVGSLYHDGEQLVMPVENIMRCLMEAGTMVLVPGSKAGKTFKAQTQSGIMPTTPSWPFLVDGEPIPFGPLKALIGNKNFQTHRDVALSSGFELFAKRAKIGAQKHIRIRPRFTNWSTAGQLVVTDEQIDRQILQTIFDRGGRYKGLGDWRPGSKTPGSFGVFEAGVVER